MCYYGEGDIMQRYFVEEKLKLNHLFSCQEDQIKHMSRVMRFRPKTQVICIDPFENVFLCEIQNVDSGQLLPIEKLDDNHELDVDVTLVYGLPKNDKFEFVLQKTTELGVNRIVPFFSQRSVIKGDKNSFSKKYVRYQRILKEASEQSGRLKIPKLMQAIKLNEISQYLSDYNLVAYEEASKQGEASHLSQVMNSSYESITIIVGPEGGFDEKEITYMKSLGIVECSLGKRILRSETAPLYMMSVIGYTRELMK